MAQTGILALAQYEPNTSCNSHAQLVGTSVKMLETFYSKVSPQMNVAIHSGRLEMMWREEQED